MTLQEFVEKHKTTSLRRDSCNDLILPGFKSQKQAKDRQEYRSHIYDNGDGRFGICLMLATARKLGSYIRQALAAGFTQKQLGDTEATLLFDPTNDSQARVALKLCRVRNRKVTFGVPKPVRQLLILDLEAA